MLPYPLGIACCAVIQNTADSHLIVGIKGTNSERDRELIEIPLCRPMIIEEIDDLTIVDPLQRQRCSCPLGDSAGTGVRGEKP